MTSPGTAIAIDAGSYFLAATCIALMHLPAGLRMERSTVRRELHEGWRDFWSRPWLWAIVIQFGVVNAAQTGAVFVLGPAVAKQQLGGPAAWGAVLTAQSVGLVLCGLLMLRWRPRRILRTATFGVFPMVLILTALAQPAPLPIVIADAVGTRETFIGAAVLVATATALVLLSRDVRTLERRTAKAN